MFYTLKGSSFNVNCEVKPSVDISGIGFRCALYLDALLTIISAKGHVEETPEVLFSNFAHLATALLLLATAFFNSELDAPHAIIVFHILAILSSLVFTVNEYPLTEMHNRSGRKLELRLAIMDLLFRPFILAFNLMTWNALRILQKHPEICSEGAGKWVFFSRVIGVTEQSVATWLFFVMSILNIILEGSRLAAEIGRRWVFKEVSSGMDPRLWVLQRLWRQDNDRHIIQLHELLKTLLPIQRVLICVYAAWTIERIIVENGLQQEETIWTVDQCTALGAILLCVFLRLRHCYQLKLGISSLFLHLTR